MPVDTSRYNDREELTNYVWRYYADFERLALRSFHGELKAQYAESEQMRQTMLKKMSARGIPEVDDFLPLGIQEFRARTADRVLAEHAATVFVNRCGCCNRIVASPSACQCLWCGHDWHRTPPKVCLPPE